MKDLLKNTTLILITIGILYLIFLNECGRNDTIIYDTDTVEVVTTIHDTVYIEVGKTVYLTKYVKADTVYIDTSQYTHYADSIVNDSIRFWQDVFVSGEIDFWNQRYEPIYTIRETQTVKEVKVTQKVDQRELFLSGIGGFGNQTYELGVCLDYVNKQRNIYGIYVTYSPHGVVTGGKIGKKIF